MEVYIGEIHLLPYTFVVEGWLPCDGRQLPIRGNEALYAVIGATYGGDGQTNFNLPDLRSAVPAGPNSTEASGVRIRLGQKAGSPTAVLTSIPSHTHTLQGQNNTDQTQRSTKPDVNSVPSQVLFNGATSKSTGQKAFSANTASLVNLSLQAIGPAGQNQPAGHPNQQPYLPVNFMIAVQGEFPPFD